MGLLFPALLVPIIVTAVLTFRLGVWPLAVSVFAEGIYIWMLFRGVAAASPADCWGAFPDQLPETEEAADARER